MNNISFTDLRSTYKTFIYKDFSIAKNEKEIILTFDFEIEGLCSFHPTTKIRTENLKIINDFDSPTAKKLVFSLGMVELISYWKSACCPFVRVECGSLSAQDKEWWKKLYFNGLSEFFYRNSIKTDMNSFMSIDCKEEAAAPSKINMSGINIIPVGGGKDSAVTAELMKISREKNMFFTVNDQKARTETVKKAGYTEEKIIRTYRTISPELLELNKKGFLNGHTPFSAIVAFLCAYCAYLIGAKYIVLSNEASANESNLIGAEVNHQYSKSYQFEKDFVNYIKTSIVEGIEYFSILRPFNELQIAKQFAAFTQYHSEFRSCNAGSKTNVWCGKCAKCLFVYCILSPFIDEEKLIKIFGKNMLDDVSLKNDFDGLCGFSPLKPFECVGTFSEVRLALTLTVKKYESENKLLPGLLEYFRENIESVQPNLLREYNNENNIPAEFVPYVKEMYDYVSGDN